MTESYREVYNNILAVRGEKSPEEWPDDLKEAARIVAGELVKNQEAPFFPLIVYLEPTNACNSNCVICPRKNMTRRRGYMKKALFEKIVAQIAATGPSETRLFNFGEPTLHPELPAMVKCCRDAGLRVSIQSNGMWLPEKLVEELLDAGLSYLDVSVNGLTEKEYETIRPGHKMEKVESNLARARAIATKKNKPLAIHINAQILRADVETRRPEIDAYAKKWLEIANSVSISGLSLYDNIMFVNKGSVTESQMQAMPRKSDEDVRCMEPFNRLIIKWDGRATVCCADYDAKYVVGDLNTETLAQTWNSDKIKAIRNIIKNKKYKGHPLCDTCPLFYSEQFSIVYNRQAQQ